MANTIFTPNQFAQVNSPKVHHYIRTPLASIFGFFAVSLIMLSFIVVWVGRTLTDTNTYVQTVGPLVSDRAVQDFIVTKAAAAINVNEDLPIRDIAGQIFTPEQLVGKTDEQLRVDVTTMLQDTLRGVVSSPSFARFWKESNKNIHAQLIAQLDSNAEVVRLDFRPVVAGAIDQLSTTRFAFLKDKLQIKDDSGLITLQSDKLGRIKQAYAMSRVVMLGVALAAVLFTALSIWISVAHLRTARRILVLTGIYSLILAVILDATSFIASWGMGELERRFAVALVQGLTHNLQLFLYGVAAVSIAVAIGSKVYSTLRLRRMAKSGQLSSIR